MGRRKRFSPEENVEIVDISAKGKAVGKKDGKTYFVEGVVPGDVATIQPLKKKKGFFESRLISIEKESAHRTKAFCSHFGTCGGCKWQHFDYNAQLVYKQKQVEEAFARIGKVELPEIAPILGCEETTYYRNKLEYTFSHARWLEPSEIESSEEISNREALGFHIPGRFDKILDIETCYLQAEPSNAIRLFVKQFAIDHNIPFYDLRAHTGNYRTLLIRSNVQGEFMLILSLTDVENGKLGALANAIQENFPQVKNFGYFLNNKVNDSYYDLEYKSLFGSGYLTEKLGRVNFKIGPKSFFQTNTKQCIKLYDKVTELAKANKNDVVYDLYSGLGSIGCYLGKSVEKVVGIESVSEAVALANENAKANNLEHVSFYCGDMKDAFSDEFVAREGKASLVILDPPRAGLHEDVIKTLLRHLPERIIYVSCNPSTQARDVALLAENYKVSYLQAVDMFPHTHHVESIAKLERV